MFLPQWLVCLLIASRNKLNVMIPRALLTLILAAVASASAFAQLAEAKLETFKVGKYTAKGDLVVSEPTKEFEFKGTEDNIYFRLTLSANAKQRIDYKVLILDSEGRYAHDYKQVITPGAKEQTHKLLLPAGTYTVNLVKIDDDEKVFSSFKITVVDNVGNRATGNQKAAQAKLWVCETVDDNWMPVGAKYNEKEKVFEWTAGKNFDVLIKNNSKPFGTTFLGIIVHTQGADGKDTGFVDEWQSDQLNDKESTMWCTVGGLPNASWIKPGRYTIYIIDWYKRQVNEHPGNFKEYFSKITLVVK